MWNLEADKRNTCIALEFRWFLHRTDAEAPTKFQSDKKSLMFDHAAPRFLVNLMVWALVAIWSGTLATSGVSRTCVFKEMPCTTQRGHEVEFSSPFFLQNWPSVTEDRYMAISHQRWNLFLTMPYGNTDAADRYITKRIYQFIDACMDVSGESVNS